ncbi:MAG: hypothetical protein GY708_22140 [Actinomycetia bacterium]|nr:hypothetical protein [Actinomycetes bacterium]MCP4958021.1 hypothetical protein [Actinomycetes bacterium]
MIIGAAFLLIELAVLFMAVAFGIHLVQRRLGPDRVRAWMGGRPPIAALKGIAIGFITPFCTFSAIPLLVGLRKAGVPAAGYTAFIVAAPVLDPVLFGALAIIVGLNIALTYAAIAFTAAFALAMFAEAIDLDRHLKPIPAALVSSPAGSGCSTEPAGCSTGETEEVMPWRGLRKESEDAWAAAIGLVRSFGPMLLAGVTIGLLIEAFVSADTAARIAGENSPTAIPIAAALGVPLYFNTELFVPIADSLRTAGVGVGAIVALTVAGAGANVPEFLVLTKLVRPKAIAVFAGYIFAVAMTGGFIAASLA